MQNQIKACKAYMQPLHPGANYLVYQDEGFSGASFNRPQFRQMMQDAKSGKLDALVCYRLDRISGNVLDFSQLIDWFQKQGILFVSLREQFDTQTPMGRAMMYIASVFAQLERETIAERIRDNMDEMAKLGQWLGGTRPTGYRSIAVPDAKNEKKKRYQLLSVPEEQALVQEIFSCYLKEKCIGTVARLLNQEGRRTVNQKPFSFYAVRFILQNPVYCKADVAAYAYLKKQGCHVYGDLSAFDGTHGLMAYRKTAQTSASRVFCPMQEWIVAPGNHFGIIDGSVWADVQQKIRKNSSGGISMAEKGKKALLSGLLFCKQCGHAMRAKTSGNFAKDGTPLFYYLCKGKEQDRFQCCMKNLNGNEADTAVWNALCNLVPWLLKTNWNAKEKRALLQACIQKLEWNGEKLVLFLSKTAKE